MKNNFILIVSILISIVFIHSAISQNVTQLGLPEDINGYSKWTRINKKVINPQTSDPHRGFKRVYVNKSRTELLDSNNNQLFPYPEGTVVVKEVRRTRKSKSKISLVAIMRKLPENQTTGGWDFVEFSNSGTQFNQIQFPKENCYSCHNIAANNDSVYTKFTP